MMNRSILGISAVLFSLSLFAIGCAPEAALEESETQADELKAPNDADLVRSSDETLSKTGIRYWWAGNDALRGYSETKTVVAAFKLVVSGQQIRVTSKSGGKMVTNGETYKNTLSAFDKLVVERYRADSAGRVSARSVAAAPDPCANEREALFIAAIGAILVCATVETGVGALACFVAVAGVQVAANALDRCSSTQSQAQ